MPQKKSYFALQLPKRWWVFGLDLALHNDIDVYQFKFFAELIQEKVLSSFPLSPFWYVLQLELNTSAGVIPLDPYIHFNLFDILTLIGQRHGLKLCQVQAFIW